VVMLVVASSRRRHLVVMGMFGHVPFWGRSLCWHRHRLLPQKCPWQTQAPPPKACCFIIYGYLNFLWNSLFDLAEIRTLVLRHISPGCWPLDHRWHRSRWGNMVLYSMAQVYPPSLTPLPWVRATPPPARPPFWPAWAARQPRKTRNFERVLRALPLICTP
jgi:hypothetical protein